MRGNMNKMKSIGFSVRQIWSSIPNSATYKIYDFGQANLTFWDVDEIPVRFKMYAKYLAWLAFNIRGLSSHPYFLKKIQDTKNIVHRTMTPQSLSK